MYYASLPFSCTFLFSLDWIIPLFYCALNTLVTSSACINSFSVISSLQAQQVVYHSSPAFPRPRSQSYFAKLATAIFPLPQALPESFHSTSKAVFIWLFLNLGGSLWLPWQIVVEVTVCGFWHQDIKRQLVFCLAVSLKALTFRSPSLLRESSNRPRWAEHIVRAETPSWQPAATTGQVSKWPLR